VKDTHFNKAANVDGDCRCEP